MLHTYCMYCKASWKVFIKPEYAIMGKGFFVYG